MTGNDVRAEPGVDNRITALNDNGAGGFAVACHHGREETPLMLVPVDRLAAIAATVTHARDTVFEATRGSTDPAAAEARSALVNATNQITRAARAPAWSFRPGSPVERPVQIALTLAISGIAGVVTYACRVIFADPAVITIPVVVVSIFAGGTVLDVVARRFWPTTRPFHARAPARTDDVDGTARIRSARLAIGSLATERLALHPDLPRTGPGVFEATRQDAILGQLRATDLHLGVAQEALTRWDLRREQTRVDPTGWHG